MTRTYKNYTIEIFDDKTYMSGSVDNLVGYDIKYISDENPIAINKHGIKIIQDGAEISSAVIDESGGGTTIHEHSCIIKDPSIFICCGNKIYSLDILSLNLNWFKQLDLATCFGIYEFEDDFIIHGEVEISRLTKDGMIKWQFSGRDIFVAMGTKPAFEVVNDVIKLTDFQNHRYSLSGDGREID